MIIVTAVGSDQPGMANALVGVLFESGCNIEDTTMTRLCGQFAMILVVSPPEALSVEQLHERFAPLESSHGLFIGCKNIEAQEEETARPRHILSAYGPEKSGLLAAITRVLASHQVNITDVQTRVASHGAAYIMIFELELPADLSTGDLQAALNETAESIGVKVSLQPMEEDAL